MPLLGDILASARRSAGAFLPWLESADPGLAARVRSAAGKAGLSPGGFVRVAVADFGRFASEEDWATLTSTLRNESDPGGACLFAMVHWRLTAAGCGEHALERAAAQQGGDHARHVE